ncbi:SCP1.201-like deaminase [Amycolatopsis sp. QT-25]|uniref:DddA-like double-stranded DNA deaminase toxin n=1 Tax=Amycolatopsis sp. QT-25 TaxID=3034022 RepID=UPI0023ECE2E4|nr:DddA-like double-stranded DNA deaminase toxin [Amycolatopsis sp. QT-25]WET81638.1 SCP1.201-like deaminase [Amycolatopsis sp. QT-25]
MRDIKVGLRRTVFYSISGGFVSVAFGLLGAGAAQAKLLPGDGPGAAQPKAAPSGDAGLKAASALPGPGGVMAKAANAAVKANESVKKDSGNRRGSASTGNSGSKKTSGNGDKKTSGNGDSESGGDSKDVQRSASSRSGDDDSEKASKDKTKPDRAKSEKDLDNLLRVTPGAGAVRIANEARKVGESPAKSSGESGGGKSNAKSGGSVPGMVGSVSEVSPQSETEKGEQAGKGDSVPDSDAGDVLRPIVGLPARAGSSQLDSVRGLATVKTSDDSAGTFPIRMPDPNPVPRNADPDRRQPPKYDDVAHGKVIDRGEAGRGKYEEDHGDGVTTVKDLKTGTVYVNGFDVSRPGAPPVSKLIPALQDSLKKKAPDCATNATLECGDPEKEAVADTARRVEELCSGAIKCSDDFVLGAVSTRINRGEQPTAGNGATEIMKTAVENGGTGRMVGRSLPGPRIGSLPRISPGAKGGPVKGPVRSGTSTREAGGTAVRPAPATRIPRAASTRPVDRAASVAGAETRAASARSAATRPADRKTVAPSDAAQVPTLPRTGRPAAKTAEKGTARPSEDKNAQQPDTGASCPPPNSFVPGTMVLMADGTYKPIEQVRLGDRVLATDPTTGLTQARPVINLIPGQGLKELVRITVDTDGDQGNATGTVTATDKHPFWVADTGHWTDAEDLDRGHLLRTPDGRLLEVVAVHEWTQHQQVHNLTIEGLHTYYVNAGGQDILTHNADEEDCGADDGPEGRNLRGKDPLVPDDAETSSRDRSQPSAGTPNHSHDEPPSVTAARRELPPPVVRNSGAKTHGRWTTSGEPDRLEPIISGTQDDMYDETVRYLEKLGLQRYAIASHVETKLAVYMARTGLRDVTVTINHVPCRGPLGCDTLLPTILPEGARLTVYGTAKDGTPTVNTYTGRRK